jgi:hypothetical protein
MRSYTEVSFWRQGTPVGNPLVFNQIVSDPDITDAWEVIGAAIVALYALFTGFGIGSATAAIKALEAAFSGKNVKNVRTSRLLIDAGGKVLGQNVLADEARVCFRAWSDDDLTASYGRVDQADTNARIVDVGERRYQQGDNNFYEHCFSIHLGGVTSGNYVFSFASGDDGWFFDVGVASGLAVTVTPAPVTGTILGSINNLVNLPKLSVAKTAQPDPKPARPLLTFAETAKMPFKA